MSPAAGTVPKRSAPVGTIAAPRVVLSGQVPANGLYSGRLKRWFDLALGLMSFPVIIPLGFFVALIIKLDSPGPILVRLERMGKGGSRFGQYKFRTMVAGAEQVLGGLLESDIQIRKEFEATYKIKNDPRVTGVGRLLRKTSIDELPQILNVLKGEMSWVGPRPIRPDELKMYGDRAPIFLSAVPGITGLWQVSGRSELSYSERVDLDMRYIKTIGFRTDLRIIFRTARVMFTGDGAF
jgi:exopolysaccharide production protein ExoY